MNPLVFREGKGKREIQSPRQVGTQRSALQGTFQILGVSSTSLPGAGVVARARVALVLYPGGHKVAVVPAASPGARVALVLYPGGL